MGTLKLFCLFSSRQIFENLKFELQINLEIKKNKKPSKIVKSTWVP